jgi:hypothetical protein
MGGCCNSVKILTAVNSAAIFLKLNLKQRAQAVTMIISSVTGDIA